MWSVEVQLVAILTQESLEGGQWLYSTLWHSCVLVELIKMLFTGSISSSGWLELGAELSWSCYFFTATRCLCWIPLQQSMTHMDDSLLQWNSPWIWCLYKTTLNPLHFQFQTFTTAKEMNTLLIPLFISYLWAEPSGWMSLFFIWQCPKSPHIFEELINPKS